MKSNEILPVKLTAVISVVSAAVYALFYVLIIAAQKQLTSLYIRGTNVDGTIFPTANVIFNVICAALVLATSVMLIKGADGRKCTALLIIGAAGLGIFIFGGNIEGVISARLISVSEGAERFVLYSAVNSLIGFIKPIFVLSGVTSVISASLFAFASTGATHKGDLK